jgi:ABC-2 type transport system permease protein
MPGWLQPFARNQPATVTINAVRALFEGGPVAQDLYRKAAA